MSTESPSTQHLAASMRALREHYMSRTTTPSQHVAEVKHAQSLAEHAADVATAVNRTNAETLLGNSPLAEQDAMLGLGPPRRVPVWVLGDVGAAKFAETLKAAGFETYTDCNGTLCVTTAEYAQAHRELVRAERQAELDSKRRHADLVRMEGERNKAHGYMSCQDETATIVNGRWICHCPKVGS